MGKKNDIEAWLRANDAADFVNAFKEEGYADVRDLDEEAIRKIVPLKGQQNKLIRLLAQHKKTAETPGIPELPPGATLDVSEPRTPEGEPFTLPSVLGDVAHAEALVSALDLDPVKEWPIIARETRLLIAYRMDRDRDERAEYPALVWKVPETRDFVQDLKDTSYVVSSVTHSERENAFAKAGFTRVAASASYLFAAVSSEVTHQTKESGSTKTTKIYMTGMWRYPRARLFMHQCTDVSPKFVNAVEQALKTHGRGYRGYKALGQVFAAYGHVVPWVVALGGQLFLEHVIDKTASIDESTVENGVRVALSAKIGSFGGSGSVSRQTASTETHKALDAFEQQSLTARGGDTLLATNPKDWTASVAKPMLWTTIDIEETKPTVDLLPEALRKEVLALCHKYKAADAATLPAASLDERVFSIQAMANPTDAGKCVMVPIAERDKQPIKLPLMSHDDAAQRNRVQEVVGAVLPNQDAYRQTELHPRMPAPPGRAWQLEDATRRRRLVLPSRSFPGVHLIASSPGLTSMHKWRFTFSGERDDADGAPLYWIEHVRSGRLLGWDVHIQGIEALPPVLLVEPQSKADPTASGRGALWRIDPVDETRGPAHAYTITHFATRQALHVLDVYREALGDDGRLAGGGPSLYDRWKLNLESEDAKRARFNAGCWLLNPLAD